MGRWAVVVTMLGCVVALAAARPAAAVAVVDPVLGRAEKFFFVSGKVTSVGDGPGDTLTLTLDVPSLVSASLIDC